jgi:hypothetical protein
MWMYVRISEENQLPLKFCASKPPHQGVYTHTTSIVCMLAGFIRKIQLKCFAFELAGPKKTRCKFPAQSKASGKIYINVNVSEREDRLALLSVRPTQTQSTFRCARILTMLFFKCTFLLWIYMSTNTHPECPNHGMSKLNTCCFLLTCSPTCGIDALHACICTYIHIHASQSLLLHAHSTYHMHTHYM